MHKLSTSTILRQCSPLRYHARFYRKPIHTKEVRQKFLDYFIRGNKHQFVKSSPVVPFCDPSVPFVNAGMNQFKYVFLGTQMPKYPMVANSQKCIRVGGKHNDLDNVGLDGYHHTFFEMLGNWSFGDYSKKEACELAYKLLTDVYKINKRFLYITYFGGDTTLQLPPDLECLDIWRSIGVPDSRIIPFGRSDNFWEMGLTGPCGPCTEIHYDHLRLADRSEFVNRGLHDLVELWNLVFIEYNMNTDGTVKPLGSKHLDTGMGLERLTAALQNTTSNYNTDSFRSIFNTINKVCANPQLPRYLGRFGENDWNFLDRDYRILADHARMITVALSDGMIPEQNQKLRRIMRKAFSISANTFNRDDLLLDVCPYVVDQLGEVYPEIQKNIQSTLQIIEYESNLYKSLRTTATKEWQKLTLSNPELEELDVTEMPGLIAAFKDIKTAELKRITPEYGYKLYDTFGLDNITISALCKALNIDCNVHVLAEQLEMMKLSSKRNSTNFLNNIDMSKLSKLTKTDDSFKYAYFRDKDEYQFHPVQSKVLMILDDNNYEQEKVQGLRECELILDKTNLYTEAGGQMSDVGSIQFETGTFHVHNLKNVGGYILHRGLFSGLTQQSVLKVNDTGAMTINKDVRFKTMSNHTCVHLLNASFKELKLVSCQKSSKVTNDYCNLDVSCFSEKVTMEDVEHIERRVNSLIADAVPVNTLNINSQDLLNLEHITLIPGEVYPDSGIRLIDIQRDKFWSREPCCGTHVQNTIDLGEMCVVGFRSLGRSTSSIYAVTGDRAVLARGNGAELLADIEHLQKNVDDNIDKPEVLEMAVTALRSRLNYEVENTSVLPILVKHKARTMLDAISKKIRSDTREKLREFIEMEMKNALAIRKTVSSSNKAYLIHYLRCSMILENVSLQRATSICNDIPVLVISYSDSIVKARCCVPKDMTSENFTADQWLSTVLAVFSSTAAPSVQGQDPTVICQMRATKINMADWGSLLKKCMETANKYAERHL